MIIPHLNLNELKGIYITGRSRKEDSQVLFDALVEIRGLEENGT